MRAVEKLLKISPLPTDVKRDLYEMYLEDEEESSEDSALDSLTVSLQDLEEDWREENPEEAKKWLEGKL